MSRFGEVVARLAGVIESRRGAPIEESWAARLLADRALASRKLGEEALETVIAALQGDRPAVIAESADLIFHWLVVLAAAGVALDDVADALEGREGRSGLEEKASRSR